MYANGFLQEQRRSPVSLAAVVGLHASAFALLVLYGTTTYVRQLERNPSVINIPLPEDPPPIPPPPPRADRQVPQSPSIPTSTPPDAPPISNNPIQTGPAQSQPPTVGPVGPVQIAEATIPRIPEPIHRGAEVDPRFRDALQPPYPREQEAAQREGRVRVRITIGTDGRVTAIEQVASTNESFWRVTQRQALNRWRFRPATVDGRPVVSTMLFTVTFRLPDA
jgi:protein TonB